MWFVIKILAEMYDVHIEVLMWNDKMAKTEKLKQTARYGDFTKPTYRVFHCNYLNPWSPDDANHYRPIYLKNEIMDVTIVYYDHPGTANSHLGTVTMAIRVMTILSKLDFRSARIFRKSKFRKNIFWAAGRMGFSIHTR